MESQNPPEKLTYFLRELFNDILRTEESITLGRPENLTLKEIHVIEAIAKTTKNGLPPRASDIASALQVAPGTLTAAADLLEKKGYVSRIRDKNDRRSMRMALTEAGLQAQLQHQAFHRELTDEILATLSDSEAEILVHALDTVQAFFHKKRNSKRAVKILVDSTCDIAPEEAAQLGLIVIPMNILFGETVYRQDIDITTAEFYEKLAESKISSTSTQLTPYDLEQVYREAAADGSEIVAIHLSSALSGTYQSAVLAARQVTGIYPVDSRSATIGTALLVRIAVKMRDSGKSAAEIARQLAALGERVRLLAYIPTLKYLVRGGRLSATAGALGGMLNIYPLVSVQDGALKSVGKARGANAARREIAQLMEAEGIDKEYGVVFGHAAALNSMAEMEAELAELTKGCVCYRCDIGAVVGVHSGPGAVGVAFIARQKSSSGQHELLS